MQDHLILQKGDKRYLLVRSFEQIHLITMDRRLSDQAEDWLLAQPRSVAEMNKRQLSRSTIPVAQLRGVSITGFSAGDNLQLYLKDGKRRYVLCTACTEAEVDRLFQGVERFTPPKPIDWRAWEEKRDWRGVRQTPELREKLRIAGIGINAVSFFVSIWVMYMGYTHPWLVWVCLGCFVGGIGLLCRYPAYFTLFEDKKLFVRTTVIAIYLPVMLCPTALFAALLSHCYIPQLWKSWLFGGIVTAALTVLLFRCSPEFRIPGRLIGFFLVGALLSPGVVMAVNILPDGAPVEQLRAEVMELDRSSGKHGTTYTVTASVNGEEWDIPLRRSLYEQLQKGEQVEVTLHEGFLKIPYATIE